MQLDDWYNIVMMLNLLSRQVIGNLRKEKKKGYQAILETFEQQYLAKDTV